MEDVVLPFVDEFFKAVPDFYSNVQNLVLNFNYTSFYQNAFSMDLDNNPIVQTVTFGPLFPFFFICNIIHVACNQRVSLQNQVRI